jgi:BirA family transcriptional regulator, biotin operon repressor / biotin---[acetyl-CoA-carboxylase] ligase
MDALIIGKNPIRLDSADSTNSWVLNVCRMQQIQQGSFVYTHNQNNGRGQRGAAWNSTSGESITGTLAYKLPRQYKDPEFAPILNMAVANACYDYVSWREGTEPSIKWPNDIFISGKKVAGILIENLLEKNSITWSAIGIGLNLNQESFPEDLPRACSLYQATKKKYNVDNEVPVLLQNLERWLYSFQTGNFRLIENNYNKRLYARDYRHLLLDLRENADNTKPFLGIVERVDLYGMLWVQMENGTKIPFRQKELGWIWA